MKKEETKKTVIFCRKESHYYDYVVEVDKNWKEGDDPFDGDYEITRYRQDHDTNEIIGDIENLEVA